MHLELPRIVREPGESVACPMVLTLWIIFFWGYTGRGPATGPSVDGSPATPACPRHPTPRLPETCAHSRGWRWLSPVGEGRRCRRELGQAAGVSRSAEVCPKVIHRGGVRHTVGP